MSKNIFADCGNFLVVCLRFAISWNELVDCNSLCWVIIIFLLYYTLRVRDNGYRPSFRGSVSLAGLPSQTTSHPIMVPRHRMTWSSLWSHIIRINIRVPYLALKWYHFSLKIHFNWHMSKACPILRITVYICTCVGNSGLRGLDLTRRLATLRVSLLLVFFFSPYR